MLFFLHHGYRVIAHDRRGHGRSTQTSDGHDMDHYDDDLAAVTAHLNLQDAVHIGHSTGGEVVRYIARRGESRVAKAMQTGANPGGLPKSVFDDLQAQLATNRTEFYRALPSGPVYGFNRPGVESSEAIIENWWRQGMMGGTKAHYDGIVTFSQTDFTDDLKRITVPVLVMHSDDDQIVPYADSGPLSARLVQNGRLSPTTDSRTACRPPRPRLSTPTCWPSCSPDPPGGWAPAVALHSVYSNRTGSHPRTEHPDVPPLVRFAKAVVEGSYAAVPRDTAHCAVTRLDQGLQLPPGTRF